MINTYAGIKCAQAKRKNIWNKQTKNKQQSDGDDATEREQEWTGARGPIAIYARIFQRANAE